MVAASGDMNTTHAQIMYKNLRNRLPFTKSLFFMPDIFITLIITFTNTGGWKLVTMQLIYLILGAIMA